MWIEIEVAADIKAEARASRPARALWIEIQSHRTIVISIRSRPARALWIEIINWRIRRSRLSVEAREGLVD